MPVKFLAMTDKTTGLYAIVIFKSDCRKTNAKVITSTHHKRNKQADKAITISRSKHGNKRACKVLLHGFDSPWSKNWRENFKPIIKRTNCNRVITFDSHFKTALN